MIIAAQRTACPAYGSHPGGNMTDSNCVDTCCRSVICGNRGGDATTLLFPRILRNPTCPSGKVSPMAEGGRPVRAG